MMDLNGEMGLDTSAVRLTGSGRSCPECALSVCQKGQNCAFLRGFLWHNSRDKSKGFPDPNPNAMFRNYVKIAWRNLMKNKVFSFINILGLTIGVTVCMMIFLFITDQSSFDKFHTKKDTIYRVMRGFDASKEKVPYLSAPYATALMNDFQDEIKQAVRVMVSNGLVTVNDISFNEKKLYIADAGFFELFDFPLTKGDARSVLIHPASVVLTESTAKRYFGDKDPIGQVIELDKSLELVVTGIAKDVPSNSHLDFDFVIPLSNYAQAPWFDVWVNNNLFTYVLLDENTAKDDLESRFPAFMEKYMGDEMARYGTEFDLALTQLADIYFEPSTSFDSVKHGDKKVVYIFLSIAFLILLIACINFMNLSTIQAVDRSREVGVRKVMGAMENHLTMQFIGESILLTLIACIISLCLLQLLMPFYNGLLGYELTMSWKRWPIYSFLGGVILVAGILAGTYPALYLSRFSPIQALKGKLKLGRGGFLFRQSLVVVQFCIAVFLIIGTLVIMGQMDYLRNKELGYDKEQAVVIPIDNSSFYRNLESFKKELLGNSRVASVSLMSGEPGGFFDNHNFEVGGQHDQIWKARVVFADFDYVQTMGLKIIAGRDFSEQYATDTTEAVIINRTAAGMLGYTPEQAIGKWLKNTFRDSTQRNVIGVVEDFNFLSLKETMDALVISPADDRRVAVIKLYGEDVPAALDDIEKAYQRVAPDYPFEYSFLDQKFDVLYKKDIRQQGIISIFSGLAIFIACLGLFGLASFSTAKRTKEIGVRKVLGASTSSIVRLLSRDFIQLILISIVIATPLGWYFMDRWLENFAYKIDLEWWYFMVAGSLTILIALVTVSFQSIKSALMNPVESLKSE